MENKVNDMAQPTEQPPPAEANTDQISVLLEFIRVQNDKLLRQLSEKTLLELMQNGAPYQPEHLPTIIHILKNVKNPALRNDGYLITLGKLILQSTTLEDGIIEISQLQGFETSLKLKDWLCEVLCKAYVFHKPFNGLPIDYYVDLLTKETEHTRHGAILTAIMQFKQGKFTEAYETCMTEVKEYKNAALFEAVFMINCSLMMRDTLLTEKLSLTFLKNDKLIANQKFKQAVHKVLLACYIDQNKCCEASYYLMYIPASQVDSLKLLEVCILYFNLCNFYDQFIMFFLDGTAYYELFKSLAQMKRGEYYPAIIRLRTYDGHPLKYYYLALAYWRIQVYDACLENLKQAAKVIPDNYRVHYFLGKYYYKHEENYEESKIHCERAYSLCKSDFKVISMLREVNDRLGL